MSIQDAWKTATFEKADALDGSAANGEEQKDMAIRLLSQASDAMVLCAVAMEYVRGYISGEGRAEQGEALSVAATAERLARMAYENSSAAVFALEE